MIYVASRSSYRGGEFSAMKYICGKNVCPDFISTFFCKENHLFAHMFSEGVERQKILRWLRCHINEKKTFCPRILRKSLLFNPISPSNIFNSIFLLCSVRISFWVDFFGCITLEEMASSRQWATRTGFILLFEMVYSCSSTKSGWEGPGCIREARGLVSTFFQSAAFVTHGSWDPPRGSLRKTLVAVSDGTENYSFFILSLTVYRNLAHMNFDSFPTPPPPSGVRIYA